jgi:hypothetical protein
MATRLVVGFVGVMLTAARAGAVQAQDTTVRAEVMLGGELELLFTENARLTGRGIKAHVDAGAVTLTGTVADESDRALAEQLVRGKGIARVDNELAVEEPPPPLTSADLANAPMTNEEREERRKRTAARLRALAPAAGPVPAARAPDQVPPPPPPPPPMEAPAPHPDDDM